MKRSPPLRLESLEDRTTPTTLTVSFVPDGTQIGTEQSQLFRDLNAVEPTAVWQQSILSTLQTQLASSNVTLQLVADDGASMNAPAPQDGQLRIAAVDQAFQTGGAGMALPGGGQMVVEVQSGTFGIGIGPVGPNGPPSQPQNPTPPSGTPTPPSPILPVLLPQSGPVGTLFPTSPSSSSPPTTDMPGTTSPAPPGS